jgi:uncharacterized protein YdhG (YjbR/CyaY superfamily)
VRHRGLPVGQRQPSGLGGKTLGFTVFKDHLSYLRFSGSVLGQLADELAGYTMTKSALHVPVDQPLPKRLVQKLIRVRLAEVERARPTRRG